MLKKLFLSLGFKCFLIFFFYGLPALFAFEPRHIYLTWEKETTWNHMTVNVHTQDISCPMQIVYKTIDHIESDDAIFQTLSSGFDFITGENLSAQVRCVQKLPRHFNGGRFLYHFNLEHLQPDKAYAFIVGSLKTGFSKVKKFKTPALKSTFYRFVEGGDLENPQKAEKILKLAAMYAPDALLLGGDYPARIFSKKHYLEWDAWLDMLEKTLVTPQKFLIPLILAIGNHETTLEKTYQQKHPAKLKVPFYFDYFPQEKEKKQSFFLKRFGSEIIFFILDSGHFHAAEEEQGAWLAENLKKHSLCKYKFALYHVPIYPSVRFLQNGWAYRLLCFLGKLLGEQKKMPALVSRQSLKQKKAWLPLFDKYNLTAAFEHHDEALKRTKPLKNNRTNILGTVYLGDGALSPANQIFPIQNLLHFYFAKTLGHVQFFWLVDVFPDKIVYRAISEKGKVLDAFRQVVIKK